MRKISLGILIWVFLSGCYAPRLTYPDALPTPILPTVPKTVKRGETNLFWVKVPPDVICYAGIGYWDTNGDWSYSELPSTQSNQEGQCQWTWDIPQNAKDGVAEFRGYAEIGGQGENFAPETFCIETCP